RHLQVQCGRRDRSRVDAAHADADERALDRARVGDEHLAGPRVRRGAGEVDEGVGDHRRHRTRQAGRRVDAACRGVAGVRGAYGAVVAVEGRPADALATRACVGGRAGVAVVACRGVVRVHAAGCRIAGIRRADVAVVAVGRGTADADPAGARVRRGAGVAVVAGRRVRRAARAGAGAVARAARDADAVGAGLAGWPELAGRRAAVAGHEVAVVALLAEIEDAVAAVVRDLADYRTELVRVVPVWWIPRPHDPQH